MAKKSSKKPPVKLAKKLPARKLMKSKTDKKEKKEVRNCAACECVIPQARIDVFPNTEYCVKCQEKYVDPNFDPSDFMDDLDVELD